MARRIDAVSGSTVLSGALGLFLVAAITLAVPPEARPDPQAAAAPGGPPAPGAGAEGPRRNPRLAALADNTALDLGPYRCRDRVPEERMRCETITDFSNLRYDPYRHRVLMFGGGHSATGRTDVDVLDLSTLTWSSLYPSMTCDQVAAGEIDPRGFHRATGHPVARHTYDQSVIAEVGGTGRLMLFSTEGFPGHCHRYNAPILAVAYLELAPDNTTWRYSRQFRLPWAYAAAAELDPVSGLVIHLGNRRGAGEGGMWVYDPASHEVVAFVDAVDYGTGHSKTLVYFPPTDRLYLLSPNSPQIFEITLDRADWTRSTSRALEPDGFVPTTGRGFAYDSRSRVIGGGLTRNRFRIYDPIANAWHGEEVRVASGDERPGDLVYHALDYDPVNNAYLFIADGDAGRRTWAYRYRK